MIPALTAGVDISSKHLDCTVYDSAAQRLGSPKRYDNNEAGIRRLLSDTPSAAAVIAEPTGRYGHELVRLAVSMGRDIRLAPTRQAKFCLQSMSPRVKSGPIDSGGLARFGAAKDLQAYKLKSDNVERIGQLLSARRQLSLSVSRLEQQQKALPYAAASLKGAIDDLKSRIAELDKQIKSLTKDDPQYAAIAKVQQIPGVGPVTSVAVVSRIAAKAFKSADAFAAYAGLDVRVSESGARKGKAALSKQGDAELRRLFYCCAQSSLRCRNSPYKDLYDRLRAQGQPATKALCAVARKIARICWSIAHYGTDYSADRVHAQVRAQASGRDGCPA